MVHLYTGAGKGKTSAAVGLAVRAAGWGQQVCFAQFMKGRKSGELCALEQLPQVEIFRSPRDFGFYRAMSGEDKEQLTQIHNAILQALLGRARQGDCRVMVLDEVTYPVNWKLLDEGLLRQLLFFGDKVELVLTGRDPADFLLERADYLTRMDCLRHPYEKGVEAREGVEY